MATCSLFQTAIGTCGIAWDGATIVATQLPERTSMATATRLAARSGAREGTPDKSTAAAIAAIVALLNGDDVDLSPIPCDLSGIEPFAAQVYEIARGIPTGETRTYGAIAAQLGGTDLSRKVGWTLGRNPLPIIVPCHRVIGANGRLTGFSAYGGLATKRRMLAIEQRRTNPQPGLFDEPT